MIGDWSAALIDQTIGAVHETEAGPVLGEQRQLALQLRWLPHIVGVEKCNKGSSTGLQR